MDHGKWLAKAEARCKAVGMIVPPAPTMTAFEVATSVGRKSGIYFCWRDGECVYVGKSIHIGSRIGNHHVALPGDGISWIEMKPSDLDLHELFYIWLLAPIANHQAKSVHPGREIRERRKDEWDRAYADLDSLAESLN